MAALQILILPFMLLNILGVLAGAIWLAIIGQWSVLGIGLLSMFLSAPVIGFALMPGALLTMAAAPFLGTRLWFLGFPFLLAESIYSNAIISAWCFGVVVFFVQEAGADATLPALLWAYGVAISPLSYMTQKSEGADGARFASGLITFAAQLAVVFMAIVVLAKGLDFHSLVYLCAGTMGVAALMQATVVFLVMRESAGTALSDAA
jgi:hypothetical protein